MLVGAGKMGGAMLDGWLARKLPPKKVIVLEPQPSKSIKALAKRGVRINPKGDVGAVTAMVIAVKPQTAPDALPLLAALIHSRPSSSRSWPDERFGFLESHLPDAASSAPCPTRPAPSAAASRRCLPPGATARDKVLASRLLAALGQTLWVKSEADIDAVTAVSGSGPAYVFLLVEALAEAAMAEGLPRALAEKLARVTVTGSGALLDLDPSTATVLRRNVTSPGGTTAAALEVLMAAVGSRR